MRELVYYVAVSLDGRIAAPDDTFDAFPVVGDHIDMILRDWTDTLPQIGLDALGLEADGSRFGAVVMGWNTYAAGLSATDDPYPHLDQHVLTRTHLDADVPASISLTDRDPVELVRELKQGDGADVWLAGGGLLASQLINEIDRLVLKVNPIVLGDGKSLFSGPYDARSFGLVDSTRYDSGVVINEYVRVRGGQQTP